jgi:hypothetical protein
MVGSPSPERKQSYIPTLLLIETRNLKWTDQKYTQHERHWTVADVDIRGAFRGKQEYTDWRVDHFPDGEAEKELAGSGEAHIRPSTLFALLGSIQKGEQN